MKKAKKEGHFSFFLDGYDEVNHSVRKKLIKDLKLLSDKYTKCPVIVTSRPDDVFNGFESFDVFNIQPLTLQEATSLVEKLPYDEDVKCKFIIKLKEKLFEQHKSFLSNPLLLSIMLLTYGENADIPAKLSIFYNQAFEALLQRHDAKKGGYSRDRKTKLDIQEFSRVFSLFSLQTYDKRLFKMPRTACINYIKKSRDILQKDFSSEDYLHDLLSAACLLIEDGLDISYSHRSFQEYFVALHISTTSPELQIKLVNRYWENITSDNVIYLLLEINPDLIERVLILPKLDELFLEIGVKRKVGVTHALKYLKLVYSSITISKDRFSASWHGLDLNVSPVVHMVTRLYDAYPRLSKEKNEEYREYLYDKYGDSKNIIKMDLSEVTYKTPIISDILKSNSFLSARYLQHAYDSSSRSIFR